MALELREQIKKALQDSQNILITFKKQYNGDTLSSALALKLFLDKMGKKSEIIADDFALNSQLAFLPQSKDIATGLESLQPFVITFDLNKTPLKDFSYNIENNQLKIFLTPKTGSFKDSDFKTDSGNFKYDLIITIDAEDFQSLGKIFTDNQDFFHKTTVINIDHKPENEQYGQINMIDLNVTSVAELLFNYFSQTDIAKLDQPIAQCLLTGLIAKTQSFRSPKVTPTTLMIASQLIKLGADRDLVVKNIYYTKSIETLKLWGKVLTRLKAEPASHLAWSQLEDQDFKDLNLAPEQLPAVIEELIMTAPEAKVILIFYSYQNKNYGLIYSDLPQSAAELAVNHEPFGSKRLATFIINKPDINAAAKEIVEEIKNRIKK